MKIKITAIRDTGNLDKERVVMKVTETADVGHFTLLQTGYSQGKATTGIRNTFWFPFKKVNIGDFIVLYTKAGTSSEKDFNEVKSHFFYWGLKQPIWGSGKVAAVLLHSPEWIMYHEEETPENTT